MREFISAAYQVINRVLEPIGLRLMRTNAPVRNFALFFKHLKSLGFEVKTVVDVGIAFGTSPIYDAFPRAKYFLVEPVAECRPLLEQLKQRLDADYFLVAAGAENGEITFNVHDDISGSSMFAQVEGKALDGEARKTPMRRLDSLLPEILEHPVFLKVDTQGAEIEVLKGLGTRINEIDLMILETTMMPMRHGIPQFAEIVRFCDEAGFAVYDVLEGHMRALDGALAQIDLALVRKDSPLRSQSGFFTSEQLAAYLKQESKIRSTKN
ncbi:FkbM family methyltransferase [Bradyrhizobium manausense]|uniref:FkbM family methyltransferase n=1 Tax=Bradyrhizobium manausense TaxID=989370 RepID=UPI001BA859B9|nr:FkbM family methyltransferase [Bradyrhizobium manausense]MBR0826182.1 FkbM family methyltransferase [Bradyrhizobium manausense]